LRTHTIAAAEVLEGALNKSDLRLLDQVLAGLRLVPPSREDSFASLQILRTHGLRAGIEWPDCIIAATCLRLDAPVLTRNQKHFSAVRGLRVIRPY
jgi:predicted nucleic acid-binding protein